jgi:hypothetical protein
MKVCIAGSRRLPKGQGPRLLVRTLAALPDDAIVLLRCPMNGVPEHFENSVAGLAHVLGLEVKFYMPAPTDTARGRASVYVRDIDMVEAADVVLLFFTPLEAHDGYSGTAHLMEKSLDADRPMYAYTVADDGAVERIGEYDPESLFIDIMPVA